MVIIRILNKYYQLIIMLL